MNTKLRYATVQKFAKRELLSKNFQHAVFGAKIQVSDFYTEVKLARTPEEIVYFLDDHSYKEFIEKVHAEFACVIEVCSVHR